MHFFSGGGFPFGDFGEEESGEVDNKKYYDVLGVSKEASQDAIKRAYLELVRKHHPDRGGSTEKFHEIQEAYETLSDPERRQQYNRFGSRGGHDGEDLMSMFFGRQGGGRKQLSKVRPTKKGLKLTLEQVFAGPLIKETHQRSRVCEGCRGKGGKGVRTCTQCKGKGKTTQMFQMGPGMYQQVQKTCADCGGEGETISEEGRCKGCQGKKIVEREKVVEVPVEPGVPNSYPITLPGEGDEIPDALAGDLVFVTQEQPHALFVRQGADLVMKKHISLYEALAGFEFKVHHLDGSDYVIQTAKGEVVSDQEKKVVRGLGMPFFKDASRHGNLIIEFVVDMPKRGSLSKEQLEALVALLPGKIHPRPKDHNFEMLEDFDKETMNSNEEGGKKADEEEEDEYEGMTGGCHTQ